MPYEYYNDTGYSSYSLDVQNIEETKNREPKKLIQTRLHSEQQKGNCFATVMACFLHLESAEDYPQIQERDDFVDGGKWATWNLEYLISIGWEWGGLTSEQTQGFYLVHGISKRGVSHICIYKDGELWHDPHPSGQGLVSIRSMQYLEYTGV